MKENYVCLYCDPKWTSEYEHRLKAHNTKHHLNLIKNCKQKFKNLNSDSIGVQDLKMVEPNFEKKQTLVKDKTKLRVNFC